MTIVVLIDVALSFKAIVLHILWLICIELKSRGIHVQIKENFLSLERARQMGLARRRR